MFDIRSVCMQGYLASMASSVAALEAAIDGLASSTTALGPLLNRAFGNESAQAEANSAAAATTAYQVGSFVRGIGIQCRDKTRHWYTVKRQDTS